MFSDTFLKSRLSSLLFLARSTVPCLRWVTFYLIWISFLEDLRDIERFKLLFESILDSFGVILGEKAVFDDILLMLIYLRGVLTVSRLLCTYIESFLEPNPTVCVLAISPTSPYFLMMMIAPVDFSDTEFVPSLSSSRIVLCCSPFPFLKVTFLYVSFGFYVFTASPIADIKL